MYVYVHIHTYMSQEDSLDIWLVTYVEIYNVLRININIDFPINRWIKWGIDVIYIYIYIYIIYLDRQNSQRIFPLEHSCLLLSWPQKGRQAYTRTGVLFWSSGNHLNSSPSEYARPNSGLFGVQLLGKFPYLASFERLTVILQFTILLPRAQRWNSLWLFCPLVLL